MATVQTYTLTDTELTLPITIQDIHETETSPKPATVSSV